MVTSLSIHIMHIEPKSKKNNNMHFAYSSSHETKTNKQKKITIRDLSNFDVFFDSFPHSIEFNFGKWMRHCLVNTLNWIGSVNLFRMTPAYSFESWVFSLSFFFVVAVVVVVVLQFNLSNRRNVGWAETTTKLILYRNESIAYDTQCSWNLKHYQHSVWTKRKHVFICGLLFFFSPLLFFLFLANTHDPATRIVQ